MLKALQIGAISKVVTADSQMDSLAVSPEAMEDTSCNRPVDSMDQYYLFHDYLGLFNIVSSMRDQNSTTHSMPLERRDSLGSAASSDFSISTGSADSNECSDFFSYPTTPTDFFRPLGDSDDMLMATFGHHESAGHHCRTSIPSSTLLERGNLSVRVPNRPMKQQVCVFCRNNGESESFYTSHCLKDAEGKVTCPVLRAYTCPLCGANGDLSHTIKYCPENNQVNKVSATVANQMKRATITITRKK